MSAYKDRRAKGLCGKLNCEVKPEAGKSFCPEHLEESRQRTAARRKASRAAGMCITCGCNNHAESGHTRCAACAAQQSAEQQQRVASRHASGLCGCGKRPPKEGCVSCQECITTCTAVSLKHYYRKKDADVSILSEGKSI